MHILISFLTFTEDEIFVFTESEAQIKSLKESLQGPRCDQKEFKGSDGWISFGLGVFKLTSSMTAFLSLSVLSSWHKGSHSIC